MEDLLEKTTGFMGAKASYQEADAVLVGVPMDFTVSFRPGTRMAPQQIRAISYGLEEYSVYLDRSLEELCFCDVGDIALPYGNVKESLQRIEMVARQLLADGKFPLFIGGEHLITYAIVKAIAERYPGLAVIQFDAHADLRHEYAGETYSHATVMRHVSSVVGSKNIYQFGIRSGTRDEFLYARQHTRLYVEHVSEALAEVVKELADRPVYVTLDIDVIDPAYAPGTGTPEPGGCSALEIMRAIHGLRKVNVVGFDLVEVAPVYDPSECTALLAAKLIREALLAFC